MHGTNGTRVESNGPAEPRGPRITSCAGMTGMATEIVFEEG